MNPAQYHHAANNRTTPPPDASFFDATIFSHITALPHPHAPSFSRLKLEIANDKPWLQESVAALVQRMYSSRGLHGTNEPQHTPGHNVTLAASADEGVLGTLSIRVDGEHGLLADELYRSQIDAIRKAGGLICEATRLALDARSSPRSGSSGLLAMLFNAAFVIARSVHRCTDLLIECHPRHANYYRRMIGCEQIGALATCPRVGAPAVLLHLSLAHVETQIIRRHSGAACTDKNLYRHSLHPQAQRALQNVLLTQH